MSKLKCTLFCHSSSAHLHQLYTGLWMLHRSGVIDLTLRSADGQVRYAVDAPHLKDAQHAHMEVVVNDQLRVHFDTHDAMDIAVGALQNCDVYLKRSYQPNYLAQLPLAQARKVLPLGLNYHVLPDTVDVSGLRRSVLVRGSLRERLSTIRQAVDIHDLFGFQARLGRMESVPDFTIPPRVLFLVAAYDPFDDPNRAPDKVEERIYINETRARCIRLLSKEFGDRFFGGFADSAFSRKNYPDLIVSRDTTEKKNYIDTVKAHPICVASTGLHGSIGWKFAEYVAFSKAIISERLIYTVPGQFACGKNYLEFTSPESCVEAAAQLMQNDQLRNELMTNNAAYYQTNLRPDSLMLNALRGALQAKSSNVAQVSATIEPEPQSVVGQAGSVS